MMGRLNHDQGQLFYSFCLEDVVPDDHRVREIAAVLDLSWVHGELAPHYSHLGRPSIDPVLMIRMLIGIENRGFCAKPRADEPRLCSIVVQQVGFLCRSSFCTRTVMASRVTLASLRA
jgi:hypothetical protein